MKTWEPFYFPITNLLLLSSDNGTRVGYQAIVALREMKEWTYLQKTLDQDIDPRVGVHNTDLKPSVNSYIQQLA